MIRQTIDPHFVPGKVLMVSNTAWNVHNFRRNLALRLQDLGSEVVVVAPHDGYAERLQQDGLRWIDWQIDRSGLNPVLDSSSLLALCRIYRQEKPDLIHHFTIKPILYGTIAAKVCRIPAVVNSVTGLGHVFTSEGLAARCLRGPIQQWYVWALTTKSVQALFQNQDDLDVLGAVSSRLGQKAILTRGSGVDLDLFAPSAVNGNGKARNGRKRALFAGRLIREKGIHEFLEAARICQDQGLDVEFTVCGAPDPGNRSSISHQELMGWQAEGLAEFLGHVDCIGNHIAESDIIVLPSYREGTPRVLLEAAAMGKPIITSDVPGCREVVIHGENGMLVPARDTDALASAIRRMLGDETMRHDMGQAGRRRMVECFDERHVISQTLRIYENSTNPSSPADNPAQRHLPRGAFVFSLDFELAWGTRGRPSAQEVGPFLDGTRDAIQGLLARLEDHDISATWAIVGAMLLQSTNGKRHPWLAGEMFNGIPAGNSTTAPHWYAEDILEWLIAHPAEQELACHTLTHQFVDASPAGREAFREELQRFRSLFADLYLEQPTSFIFPKARMGNFDVLVEEGFRNFRGPEDKWFEALPGQFLSAGVRMLDATLARPPRVELPERRPEGLWMLPSSQFYSPFMRVGQRVTVEARVRKALQGLREAADKKRLFHLWTHPFNLGVRSDELLGGLDAIFAEARRLADAGEIDILTMGQLSDRLDAAETESVEDRQSAPAVVR